MDADADPPRDPRDVLDEDPVEGPAVPRFEERLAERCGVDRAVATTNRTTALSAALAALGLGDGDRVLCSPLAFVGGPNAVRLHGATVVFGDVHPGTLTLDPCSVEHLLEHARPADALLASHAFGLPAGMDRLREIADEHDLALIEDVGPALGATVDGEPVGSFGDAACASVHPFDGARSVAGAVLTDRRRVAERARRFVDNGRRPDGAVVDRGTDARPANLFAALALAELDALPGRIEIRRANARRLSDRLQGLPVRLPVEPCDRRHVYSRYVLRADRRDALATHLRERGVDAPVPPRPVHEHPAYEDSGALATIAERAGQELLSLPVRDPLSARAIDRIAAAVESFFDAG